MTQKTFNTIAGCIFLIFAIMHLWRILTGLYVAVGTNAVPMWASWVGLVVTAILGFYGLKHGRL